MAEDTVRDARGALHTQGSLSAHWASGPCPQRLLLSSSLEYFACSRLHLGLAYTEIPVLQLAQFASALDVHPSKSPPVNSTACKGLHVSLVAHWPPPLQRGWGWLLSVTPTGSGDRNAQQCFV